MIVHCMKRSLWESEKQKESWGLEDLEKYGFIHCCTVNYLWRVLPNFDEEKEDLVLICIDEEKLNSEVRYEDDGNYGRNYPHVYGLINTSAVVDVLDYLKDENGHYRKNPEFEEIPDE